MHSMFQYLGFYFFMLFFPFAKAIAEEDGHEEHEHGAEEKISIAFSLGCHTGFVGAGITNSGGTLLGHGDCHAGLDIHGHTENGQWFEIDAGPAIGLHIEAGGGLAISGGGVIDTRWSLPRGNFRLYAGLEVHADAQDAQVALAVVPHIETHRSLGIGARIEWAPTFVPEAHPSSFSGLNYAVLGLGLVLRLETGHMSRGIYELMIIGSRAGFVGTDWCRSQCGSLGLQLRVGFDHHIIKLGLVHDHLGHDGEEEEDHGH